MVENTALKTSGDTMGIDNLSETSPEISDDWELIDYILGNSNLPHLKLQDIVQNLDEQKALVESIEPVVRLDHLYNFLKSVLNLEAWGKDQYGGWDIVFHGTLRSNVTSIIRDGFRLPGKSKHTSRFRSHWGPGIYCSPYGTYSYTYGHRWDSGTGGTMLDPEASVAIFVCAVARGRPFQCEKAKIEKYTGLEEGFDSHISHNQCEWIVFDQERIIPLCLLSIKRGIPEWFWHGHNRVRPDQGKEKDLLRLREPKDYNYQNLRDGMQYNAVRSRILQRKTMGLFRWQKVVSRRKDSISDSM